MDNNEDCFISTQHKFHYNLHYIREIQRLNTKHTIQTTNTEARHTKVMHNIQLMDKDAKQTTNTDNPHQTMDINVVYNNDPTQYTTNEPFFKIAIKVENIYKQYTNSLHVLIESEISPLIQWMQLCSAQKPITKTFSKTNTFLECISTFPLDTGTTLVLVGE